MNTHGNATVTLTPEEAATASELALRVSHAYPRTDDESLIRDLPFLAEQLPERIRRQIRPFALDEQCGYRVIAGHHVDEDRIGPTPTHWKGRDRPGVEFPEEILLLLYSALLGEPFGWATQQDGHFVNDVFPIPEYEAQLLGTGSKTPLTLHTEDAFHPYRADYIILFALRNPYGATTTIAELDVSGFPSEDLDVLFADRFVVIPDTSHLPDNNTVSDEDQAYFTEIEGLMAGDRRVPLLFGSRSAPFLRFDETHTRPADGDQAAKRVFDAVAQRLSEAKRCVQLRGGDMLILNNHRVVHGRDSFTARYDGTDRWLKRVNVTTDLRKSSSMRGRVAPRLVG